MTTEQKAIELLNKVEFKFKVGDVVRFREENYVVAQKKVIRDDRRNYQEPYYYLHGKNLPVHESYLD